MKVADDMNLQPLLLQLQLHPELWDQHPLRRTRDGSPHTAMRDIWVRFRDWKEHNPEKPAEFTQQHFPIWYPAYYALPALRPMLFWMMNRTEATHMGGVLITRIPPGERIEPHADVEWHPKFYNCKLYLPLATNSECVFRVEDEEVVMKTGELWWLDNTKEHEVVNDGPTDRMTLITCLRCE